MLSFSLLDFLFAIPQSRFFVFDSSFPILLFGFHIRISSFPISHSPFSVCVYESPFPIPNFSDCPFQILPFLSPFRFPIGYISFPIPHFLISISHIFHSFPRSWFSITVPKISDSQFMVSRCWKYNFLIFFPWSFFKNSFHLRLTGFLFDIIHGKKNYFNHGQTLLLKILRGTRQK